MTDSPPSLTSAAEFGHQLTERTASFSTRALASKSGWSRSTVNELRTGQRLPTSQQLADILGAVGANGEKIIEWERARTETAKLSTDPVRIDSPGPEESIAASEYRSDGSGRSLQQPGRARLKWLALTAAVAAMAGAAIGFSIAKLTGPSPSRITATAAYITNTEGLGVTTYLAPSRARRAPGALAEGTRVLIICQSGNGEPITDRVGGAILTWPVWDRLDDGRWVPDIYTSTNKDYRPSSSATALLTC